MKSYWQLNSSWIYLICKEKIYIKLTPLAINESSHIYLSISK